MKTTTVACLSALCALVAVARADIYLHNMRGSNNRLDEANRDRNNGNRLFDSQNNNRGGYNVGRLYYLAGSSLTLEWTNQHGCSDPNMRCNIVIQYMCDSLIRDGTTTDRIPVENRECSNNNCDTDLRYGRHESRDWYMNCQYRERNKGLFTANQNLNSDDARATRQNANANNRRGYECAEERDYYPYWAPTPWKDIAVLTDREQQLCPYYQNETQNVKGRSYCQLPRGLMQQRINQGKRGFIPISKEKCEQLSYTNTTTGAVEYGQWVSVQPWNIPPPDCVTPQWSRDNHNGNTLGGETMSYNWTVPSTDLGTNCVLRIRYNISTTDYQDWQTYDVNTWQVSSNPVDASGNSNKPSPNPDIDPAEVPVWQAYGLQRSDVDYSFTNPSNNNNNPHNVQTRDYVLRNNPRVDIFGRDFNDGTPFRVKLQLAINTNQFGRTFEDRSHTFQIRARPSNISADATIHNLNVRGKRGNIVQVYPGVEYDFVPSRLWVQRGEYVHIQWTGSNTNPANNAGQGAEGTDRSNIVVLRAPVYNEPGHMSNTVGKYGDNHFMSTADPANTFLGLSKSQRDNLAVLDNMQYGGEMSELDDAGTYFDLGAVRVGGPHTIYHYMCTRNNNFSNRDQKGVIIVSENALVVQTVGWNGGRLPARHGHSLRVPRGSLSQMHEVSLMTWPQDTFADEGVTSAASYYVEIGPNQLRTDPDTPMELVIPYSSGGSLSVEEVFWSSSTADPQWSRITDQASLSDGRAVVSAPSGGVYVVTSSKNVPAIVGIVIAVVLALVAVVAVVVYFKRHPEKWKRARRATRNVGRSFQSKV